MAAAARGEPGSVLSDAVDALRRVVGDANLRCGDQVMLLDPGVAPDNLGAGIVAAPASTAEVAAIVAICHQHGIPIVPQGGRTGLVGGGISRPGEIVLSLGRMNRIERVDSVERAAVVDAGVTLGALQSAAAAHRLEPGIDLAARGSATIGGMVSTNAGGVMAFRYGVMRHRVLGLEAVLPDGSVVSDMTRVVKNAAGYDVKQLFIGAEGTLGVVTRVVVKLEPMPRATATALFSLPSVAAALDATRLALDADSGHLRAAEVLWRSYISLTARLHDWAAPGFDMEQPIHLLLSLGGAHDDTLRVALEGIFAELAERYPETSGIIANSARQEAELWRLREDTDSLYRLHPAAPSYDVSVPLSEIGDYADRIQAGLRVLDPALAPYMFGHLADGNLHIVLNRAGPLPRDQADEIEAVLYGGLREQGGSFSAEHGIGSKRVRALATMADPGKLRAMSAIKHALDTGGIMNAGKVLPA